MEPWVAASVRLVTCRLMIRVIMRRNWELCTSPGIDLTAEENPRKLHLGYHPIKTVTSHCLKWGQLPPNYIGRITQHIREREGRKRIGLEWCPCVILASLLPRSCTTQCSNILCGAFDSVFLLYLGSVSRKTIIFRHEPVIQLSECQSLNLTHFAFHYLAIVFGETPSISITNFRT